MGENVPLLSVPANGIKRVGAEFGPLRVNFSLEIRTSATVFEHMPLEVDCGPLGVNLLRLWVDCGP